MSLEIRPVRIEDAQEISRIYEPFVNNSAVSFELTAPSSTEMSRRIQAIQGRWPWLVCESGDGLCAYAYAQEHRSRAAYMWSAEVSVYVDLSHHRRGIGRALYSALLTTLERLQMRVALAGITMPNNASVRFHSALGFEAVGTYKGVGYKHNAWRDVLWMQRSLGTTDAPPCPPEPLDQQIIDAIALDCIRKLGGP